MDQNQKTRFLFSSTKRILIEVALIVFLLFAVRLMEEFTTTNEHGKSLAFALSDILTQTNILVASISAVIVSLAFELIRKKL